MGLISDYLEQNREKASDEQCLFLPRDDSRHVTYVEYSGSCSYRADTEPSWQQELSAQAALVSQTEQSEKRYLSALGIIDRCMYRQKILFGLLHDPGPATFVVSDTIKEYIAIIDRSKAYAIEQMEAVKMLLPELPVQRVNFDAGQERLDTLSTLLRSLYYYLCVNADINDSCFVRTLFSDMAALIQQASPDLCKYSAAKDICRTYFEENYNPTYCIEVCENCGRKLYRECPHYCFTCFTYQEGN